MPNYNARLFFHPTNNVHEVTSIFQGLRNSRSQEADELQIKPIKYVIDLLAPILTHIYNLSLTTGVFPSRMQVAKVTVIYKNGDKNNFGNCRPVSVLPIFSKGIEKIINARIENFSKKHNLLTDCQHGFRKGQSTQTALLVQKETILEHFENKTMTLRIFLDFSKAFDRVNDQILLDKLERSGFR